MIEIKNNKKYLVTGGTGFLGQELIRRLVDKSSNIVVLSRNEGKLITLKQTFPSIEIFAGDVSDKFAVQQAIKNVDGVFHLAAFKHITMAESQARECAKSNIYGSLNVLEESVKENVKFIIGISTDKAAQMSGVYGASKYIMEKMFEQFEKNYLNIAFRIVRYGNVLYSTGSVLCKWRDLLKEGKEITITDPYATRFFWTLEQAVDLIFDCLSEAIDSRPFVPTMKSMSVGNLLIAMMNKYLPSECKPRVKKIGLQTGENLHEKILEDGPYSNDVEQFTIKEIEKLI